MIWEFKGLFVLFIVDVILNLEGFTFAFSIGWLIYMIINYKDIRRRM